MEKAVSLTDMLEARERRALRQRALLERYGLPLICFTINIAGEVKNSPLIQRGFALGVEKLREELRLAGLAERHFEEIREFTGNEAFLAVDADPLELKRIGARLEEESDLGRLYDIDVLLPTGEKIERSAVGLGQRRCLICGGPAMVCARSRTHTVAELRERTNRILRREFEKRDGEQAASLACRALLYEVCTTPKPGLVDRDNSGSHRDMDIFTFMASASALWPYFERCCRVGMETAQEPGPVTLRAIRPLGLQAEKTMLEATGGVNTHKGVIFSMGIVCAALGRLPRERWAEPERVLSSAAEIAEKLPHEDFNGLTWENARTAGEKLYVKYGIQGVRGQAAQGFPAVGKVGLPVLEEGLRRGLSLNEAGCAVLLHLLSADVDTNVIARSDLETYEQVAQELKELLARNPFPEAAEIEEWNSRFVSRNISPGGSADLLALCYLLYFLKETLNQPAAECRII